MVQETSHSSSPLDNLCLVVVTQLTTVRDYYIVEIGRHASTGGRSEEDCQKFKGWTEYRGGHIEKAIRY